MNTLHAAMNCLDRSHSSLFRNHDEQQIRIKKHEKCV